MRKKSSKRKAKQSNRKNKRRRLQQRQTSSQKASTSEPVCENVFSESHDVCEVAGVNIGQGEPVCGTPDAMQSIEGRSEECVENAVHRTDGVHEDLFAIGLNKGLNEGYKKGYNDGFKKGHGLGYPYGYNDGFNDKGYGEDYDNIYDDADEFMEDKEVPTENCASILFSILKQVGDEVTIADGGEDTRVECTDCKKYVSIGVRGRFITMPSEQFFKEYPEFRDAEWEKIDVPEPDKDNSQSER